MRESLLKRLENLERINEKGTHVSIVNENGDMTELQIEAEVIRINAEDKAKGYDPLIIIFDN